jgi:hypothetical protein
LKTGLHGTGLVSSYQLKYNRFIIIAVDQDDAGSNWMFNRFFCGVIQALEQKYKVDLLDKMNVTFKLESILLISH